MDFLVVKKGTKREINLILDLAGRMGLDMYRAKG